MNARKFYAVTEQSLCSQVPLKLPTRDTNDCEDTTTSSMCNDCCVELVQDVKKKVDMIFNLTATTRIPIALHRLLMEGFRCKICREYIKPPVIASKCCEQILGCDSCIKTWYQDNTIMKNCPGCNKERGFANTMKLHGLDELLDGTKEIIDDEARGESH